MLFFCYKLHTIEYIVYWDIFVFFSFTTAHCGMQFSSRGIRPGLTTMLARHLDKNTMGYLQWRWGTQSSMNTSIVRDTKSSHFTFAVQVSCCFAQTLPDLYAKVFFVSPPPQPLFLGLTTFFYCHSWEFHIRLLWWATSTNSRMMIRPRSRALSSMYLWMLPFVFLCFTYRCFFFSLATLLTKNLTLPV